MLRKPEIHLDLVHIVALAFALAFDAFGVAIAVGIKLGKLDRWTVFRLSFHFGFAQFGMPIVGWLAGGSILSAIGAYGQWLAALVLLGVGMRLIWEQFRPDDRQWKADPTRGASLLILMFATSIDALAAGLTLGLVGTSILYPTLIIGVVAAAMTILGLIFGQRLGLRFSRAAGVFGGLILIALAVNAVLP
jgi:putative Mn2+ efflux pump MntP